MKIPTEKYKLEKAELDMKIIIHSLNYACCIKYKDRILSVDKENLIYKIVDNCNVSPSKAKEYLMILQSRGIIQIDRDLVHYTNNNFTESESKKIDDFFSNLKVNTKNI